MGLTFGSLFAGIGGMDLGLERAGMKCAWQVEINEHATRVLTKHWPYVPKFGDVRECGAHNLEPVDLIAGGFPCQDISYAGLGAGIDGERSGLWSEFYRIICELRPRYVLVENVAALLDRGMGRVLGDLAGAGYDAQWTVFRAYQFGLPHLRRRVFIVAYPSGSRARFGRLAQLQAAEVIDWKGFLLPNRGRNTNGIPYRVDRLRGLGNAIVPHKAEWLGNMIRQHAALMREKQG